MPQPRRQDLSHGRQCSERRLLEPGSRDGRGLEGDGERDDLLVVEEQRREFAPGVEVVPAVRPHRGLDAIPHLPESVDVAADRAVADVQPVGEQGTRPVAPRLQEREQLQESGGR